MGQKMPSKLSKELWQNGIPLQDAWIKFGPDSIRLEYLELKNPSNWKMQSVHDGFVRRAFDTFTTITNAKKLLNELERQLQHHLESQILNGDCVAYGFRELPSRSNGPVKIDATQSMSLDIDWLEGKLSTFECSYNRVSISSKSDASQSKANAPDKMKNNSIESIKSTIKNLINENGEFVGLTRAQQCENVRQTMSINHNQYDGFSDKNIEKHLLSMCGPKRKISK